MKIIQKSSFITDI